MINVKRYPAQTIIEGQHNGIELRVEIPKDGTCLLRLSTEPPNDLSTLFGPNAHGLTNMSYFFYRGELKHVAAPQFGNAAAITKNNCEKVLENTLLNGFVGQFLNDAMKEVPELTVLMPSSYFNRTGPAIDLREN